MLKVQIHFQMWAFAFQEMQASFELHDQNCHLHQKDSIFQILYEQCGHLNQHLGVSQLFWQYQQINNSIFHTMANLKVEHMCVGLLFLQIVLVLHFIEFVSALSSSMLHITQKVSCSQLQQKPPNSSLVTFLQTCQTKMKMFHCSIISLSSLSLFSFFCNNIFFIIVEII